MCKEELSILNEDIVNEDLIEETETVDFERALKYLALEDEVERDENFKKEVITSESTKIDSVYKSGMVVAETIIAMTKKMVLEGIDYNNALAIASNHITSKQNLQLAEYSAVVQQTQQI